MKAIIQVIERSKFAAGKYDLELCKQAELELAALREAGEKMAGQLREMRDYTGGTFTPEDSAALAEWEAANK